MTLRCEEVILLVAQGFLTVLMMGRDVYLIVLEEKHKDQRRGTERN